MKLTTAKFREAIARGWCAKNNSHKEMDVDLAEGILDEILPVARSLIADEREVCAKIADAGRKDDPEKEVWLVAFDIANSIRGRNYQPTGAATPSALVPQEEILSSFGEEIELVAETMAQEMFAIHELPIPKDIADKYRATARAVLEALRKWKIKSDPVAHRGIPTPVGPPPERK